jgi:hypothetical protein
MGHSLLSAPFSVPTTAVGNPLNPQPLISHLTNSNGCGNLQTKVLLTVSPFRPFLLQQLRVRPRNGRLLPSYAPYASRMDLRDAPRSANISPILKRLRILPVTTVVSGQRTPRHSFTPTFEGSLVYPDLRGATRHCSFVFITLQIPFPATPLFSHPYKTPGVPLLRHSPSMPSPPLCPLRLCGKLNVFSSLPPLCRSWRSFLHSRPLFSAACRLFCKNAGGGGYPRHGADTEATVGSRGGKAAVGEKCAGDLSY